MQVLLMVKITCLSRKRLHSLSADLFVGDCNDDDMDDLFCHTDGGDNSVAASTVKGKKDDRRHSIPVPHYGLLVRIALNGSSAPHNYFTTVSSSSSVG